MGMLRAQEVAGRRAGHLERWQPPSRRAESPMKTKTRSNAAGFTLAELMIVVGVISVTMVGATAVLPTVLRSSRSDGSAGIVGNTMRLARDRAIGERRNMDVIFVPPDRI